jgi:hypothetical protein
MPHVALLAEAAPRAARLGTAGADTVDGGRRQHSMELAATDAESAH